MVIDWSAVYGREEALLCDFGYASLDSTPTPVFADAAYACHHSHRDRRLSDITSLGHLFYYILHGVHPVEELGWTHERTQEVYRQGKFPFLDSRISRSFKRIIRSCWDGDYLSSEVLREEVVEAVASARREAIRLDHEGQRPAFYYPPPFARDTAPYIIRHMQSYDGESFLLPSTSTARTDHPLFQRRTRQ